MEDATHGQLLSGEQLVWIQFSFETGFHTKAKKPPLPSYVLIAKRKDGPMSFPGALAQNEMQTALS